MLVAMGQIALVVGATGLVGGLVVKELLQQEEIVEVRALVRRPFEMTHPKLKVMQIDWDRLEMYTAFFADVHSVYCCLGTTIKQAGSQEQFRKVDLDYVLKTAQLAKRSGVRQFMAVSSAGASPKVRNFYLRTKGEMEEGLARIGFSGLHLFRPSLLLGERTDTRFGERLAAVLMTSLDVVFRTPRLAPYRAIPASKVARSMVAIGLSNVSGSHVYTNEVLHVLGSEG